MSDYEIGYGKPPKHTRFKKGVCPNPKGRGKSGRATMDEVIQKILNAPVEFEEAGRIKRWPRLALLVRQLTAAALQGDVASAASLVEWRAHAKRHGRAEVIYLENALPDPPELDPPGGRR